MNTGLTATGLTADGITASGISADAGAHLAKFGTGQPATAAASYHEVDRITFDFLEVDGFGGLEHRRFFKGDPSDRLRSGSGGSVIEVHRCINAR